MHVLSKQINVTLRNGATSVRWGMKYSGAVMGGLHPLISAVSLSQGNTVNLTGCRQMSTLLKFMGWDCSGSVCFVFSHKSWWKQGICRFRCHSNGVVAAVLCSFCCVQSVSDGPKDSFHLCSLPQWITVEDNAAAAVVYRITVFDSNHPAVRSTEACGQIALVFLENKKGEWDWQMRDFAETEIFRRKQKAFVAEDEKVELKRETYIVGWS